MPEPQPHTNDDKPYAVSAVKRYMTVRELAAYTGIPKSTLDKKRCYGGGPDWIEAGPRKVLYDQVDVDAWMATRKKKTTRRH